MKDFLLLSSTSEHKIRVFAHDWPNLLANALKGMFSSIEPKPALDKTPVSQKFDVKGLDREALLINFLSEALYLSAVHREAYNEVDFSMLSDNCAQGIIKGYKISGFDTCEIKAVTHHGVHIITKDDKLQTDILFDV